MLQMVLIQLHTGGVVELDLLGYVHNEYLLEGGYHHDAYELPNGNLIVLTSDKRF